MARRGISRKITTPDQNLRDVIETLAADHDVISSTVTTLVSGGVIQAGVSFVAYVGGATQTITLPPASALGANVGAVILLLNTSASAVTVVPSTGNTLNGGASISVAANALAILASDGVSKWLRNV